ncbi:(R)-specific enoyl-CoA hydratase [Methyloligella halotolerans]|uniref:(R)-specific enoyl-CoA hydratase n=1 Tax=Methyloligella halotolerans TaxID=1177755 RepID=A0A1E2RZT6_9HYPH|nr:MaoC family dehydratase [Methyloligella halotolerans]ODA67734.1 (R)-specific enoyl-CoA hydratase [Methyloligella halotolerans]
MSAWLETARGTVPQVGEFAELQNEVTMRDIELFTEITGDKNPLHYDRQLAEKSIFGGLIVQGGVTSGILNAIVAEKLPGPGTVFLNVDWSFTKAVLVGDVITGRIEVIDARDDKPICNLQTTVTNQHGEVCLSGKATTFTVPV